MKRRSRPLLSFGPLAVGLLNSCDDNVTGSGGSDGADEYFPRGVPGTWTYDYYGPQGDRVYLSEGSAASSDYTMGEESRDSSGIVLYKFRFPPHCGLRVPGVPYPSYVDSVAPRGIGDETHSIRVDFSNEIRRPDCCLARGFPRPTRDPGRLD